MQHLFKRHDKVRLLIDPDPEYVEYSPDFDEEQPQIKKGMEGKVNVLLPNGHYHVEIIDDEGKTVAYVPVDEEFLEKVES
jgi:hypothetical protein